MRLHLRALARILLQHIGNVSIVQKGWYPMRQSGILLHILSLPGQGGIGTMGKEARNFVDFLKKSGMRLWQMLPVGPTGYGESPYQCSSIFAGNPLMISLETLVEEGLLTMSSDEQFVPACEDQIDYEAVKPHKEAMLRRAFLQSEKNLADEIARFEKENTWVADFALFTAVKRHFDNQMWSKWPDDGIRLREADALLRYRAMLDEEVRYHTFVQYIFFKQWFALKKYANDNGVQLFGDMPIYVAEDSADTWTRPDVFQMDKNRVPRRVAGVPPDYFSADGQLWGNPLYRWQYLRDRGFDWWVDRMAAMGKLFDVVRIDHFIGFANYFSIAHGAPNARNGRWIVGPGKALFDTLRKALPGLNIIAEDLGSVNDRVRRLLDYCAYPGMRVLSFGFGAGDDNPHLADNYVENSVVYTGTHDNDTVRGWIDTADEESLQHAMEYLGFEKPEDGPAAFVEKVMESVADTCMVPMQDILGLDGSARMNLPGTIGGNWMWRMLPGAASAEVAERLHTLNVKTNRCAE